MNTQKTQSTVPIQPLNVANIADVIRRCATDSSLLPVTTGNAGRMEVKILDHGTTILTYVVNRQGVRGPNPSTMGSITKADALVTNIDESLSLNFDLTYDPAKSMYTR